MTGPVEEKNPAPAGLAHPANPARPMISILRIVKTSFSIAVRRECGAPRLPLSIVASIIAIHAQRAVR